MAIEGFAKRRKKIFLQKILNDAGLTCAEDEQRYAHKCI